MLPHHTVTLACTIVFVLLCLAAVAAMAFFTWLPSRRCSFLLRPTHTKSYAGAVDAIRLDKNTGTLLKYPGAEDKH